jgi:hypothetical protein
MLKTEKMNTEDRIQNVSLRSLPVNSTTEKPPYPQSEIRNYRWLSIFCLVLLVACGYQMVGRETHVPPGLNSIAIPVFKNQTFEPGIEVQFTQAFLNEFILDRRLKVVSRAEADSILEGVIKYFATYSVAYDKSGFVSQYQIGVSVDLTLRDRTGKVLWVQPDFYESQWFRASSSGLINDAAKQAAIQKTGKVMAERIRDRFFYNF